MDNSTVERELKLVPLDAAVLERLATRDRLGPFVATPAGTEQQTNAYWDTPHQALDARRLALRRRVVQGSPQATWTVKGEGSLRQGLAVRPEINVVLSPDSAPLLVAHLMIQAARERGCPDLAQALAEALQSDGALPAQPFLEMRTKRRLWRLTLPGQTAELELALDEVRLVGHPAYLAQEIEVEIHRGPTELLETARAAIEQLGPVASGTETKLASACRYLAEARSEPEQAKEG